MQSINPFRRLGLFLFSWGDLVHFLLSFLVVVPIKILKHIEVYAKFAVRGDSALDGLGTGAPGPGATGERQDSGGGTGRVPGRGEGPDQRGL